MKLKQKFELAAQKIADKISNSGVMQEENSAEGQKKVFEGMPSAARQAAAESAVLLKNDGNVLPLEKGGSVCVFGRCQIDYFYVGYGSGGDVHAPYKINIVDGLISSGVDVYAPLMNTYRSWCDANPVIHGIWGRWPMHYPEMPLDDELVSSAAKNADTAVVVIGRAAGEDRENKLEKGSYYLTDDETDMLNKVTEHFGKVVVIMNCGNIIDMSWLKKYGSAINAVIYAWQCGMESGNAVADVLTGKISPCGKLPCSIACSYGDYPGSDDFGGKDYNNYTEDIFVGYRYFETFCPQKALYPFGFGLSYTDFEITPCDFEFADGRFKASVNVKNIGRYSGKEVIQLYVSAPQGRLSKAAMSLAAFDKTDTLAPGQSCVISFDFGIYDIASFDDTCDRDGKFAYVAEKGEYVFYAGNSVRNVVQIGKTDLDDIVIERLDSVCAVQNGFDRIKAVEKDGRLVAEKEAVLPSKPYLKERIEKNLPRAVGFKGDKGYKLEDVANGKVSLDDFVSQLSNKELEALTRGQGMMDSNLGVTGNAGAYAGILPSLRDKGVPALITTDGPAGIRIKKYTSLLPCATALAATWNCDLVEKLTGILGAEMVSRGSDVLLGPGMNVQRNPLCGRNFEYFSEDPLLSGRIAAAYVKGVQKNGVSACPKHFACNNQETRRTKCDSRLSQRALREIYLKGFEICVKESKPLNIMTSYNKINGVWSHYNYDLVTTVLRGEWQYDGCVMTDWWMQHSRSPEFPSIRDNAYRVRAQVDVYMPGDMSRTARRYKSDGTLLKTLGKPGGITSGELERTAKNVLRLAIRLKLKNGKAENAQKRE